MAFHLSRSLGREVLSIYAEKSSSGEGFEIKRGYDSYVSGKRCLIVEDILNTGGSALKVIQKIKSLGGQPIGIAVLCNRGGVTPADLDHIPRLVSLIDVSFEAWSAADCPMCKKGIPINTSLGKAKST